MLIEKHSEEYNVQVIFAQFLRICGKITWTVIDTKHCDCLIWPRQFVQLIVSSFLKPKAANAYAIGQYRIDKTGTLIGEPTPELLATLAEQGFTPDNSDAA